MNRLAGFALVAFSFLATACQAERIEATGTGEKSGALGEGACKAHDELPPLPINPPNGGACPTVGSSCPGNFLPVTICEDNGRRMILTCDTATKTWQVTLRECVSDGGAPSNGGSKPPAATPATPDAAPPSSGGSSPAMCKPRSELPPLPINAPDGGACPAVGSDCQNRPSISICEDKDGHRMILTCDATTKTWQVTLKECPADGGAPTNNGSATDAGPAPSNGSSAICKKRDEIPPPLALPAAGAGPDGVCVPEGTTCDFPIALCLDKDGRRIYMECDKTTHTWRIVLKECP